MPNFPYRLVPSKSSFYFFKFVLNVPHCCSELDLVGQLWSLVWNRVDAVLKSPHKSCFQILELVVGVVTGAGQSKYKMLSTSLSP